MPMHPLLRKKDRAILRHRRAAARMTELLAAGADRTNPHLDEAIEEFSRSWVELRTIDKAMSEQGVTDRLPRICRLRGRALQSHCFSRPFR
jgi:hypothetical protein